MATAAGIRSEPSTATAQAAAATPQSTAPELPRTPSETITVLAHYHRAEIARMAGWRDRIDRTTNWAITVVAAMLSVSLSTPTAHHGVLLFAMLLVLLLLNIEARRYRFFDVYRARVRRLERNYYAQFLAPLPQNDGDWARVLGEDLRRPLFLISRAQAFFAPAAAQLYLAVPDPAARLGAEDHLAQAAARSRAGGIHAIARRRARQRRAWAPAGLEHDRVRGAFLRLADLRLLQTLRNRRRTCLWRRPRLTRHGDHQISTC